VDKDNNKWFGTFSEGILKLTDSPLSVYEIKIEPSFFMLSQNYPNPFNSSTQFNYTVSGKGVQKIKIEIFDILGRRVKSLLEQNQNPGSYTIRWDALDNYGLNCATGVYFCSLTANNKRVIRKFILIR